MRAAGEIAMWPCSSAQLQKARTTDVTFCRVRGERSPQRSMTSRRSSTETSIGSLSASVRLTRPSTASVVAERRLRRAVLVAEPAEISPDELAERCRAVALVLHGFADDPCGLAERQARSADGSEVSALRAGTIRALLRLHSGELEAQLIRRSLNHDRAA